MKSLLKNILSLFLIACLLPITGGIVMAAQGDVIYIEDYAGYDTTEAVDGLVLRNTTSHPVSTGNDAGGLKVAVSTAKKANPNFWISPTFTVKREEKKRTYLTADRLMGKFTATLEFTYNGADAASSFALAMGNTDTRAAVVSITIYNGKVVFVGGGKQTINDVNFGNGNKQKLVLTVDTINSTFSGKLTTSAGAEYTVSEQSFKDSTKSYVNVIATLQSMADTAKDSYFVLNSMKITEEALTMPSDVKTAVDALPSTLTDEVNAVTQNFTLPDVTNVVWSSENSEVISISGQTVAVTRQAEDTEATVVAKITDPGTGAVYKKYYSMTVLSEDKQNVYYCYVGGELKGIYNVGEQIPDPTMDGGYIFRHWYSTDSATPYEFSDSDTGIIKLYAKFSGRPCLVTFYIGQEEYHSTEVEMGECVTLPEVAPPQGYFFSGWKYENGSDFDENSAITNTVDLYGEYELIKYTASFYAHDKLAQIGQFQTGEGCILEKYPEAPLRFGYKFEGWKTIDGDTAFDVNAPLNGDVSVYASYSEYDSTVLLDEDYSEYSYIEDIDYISTKQHPFMKYGIENGGINASHIDSTGTQSNSTQMNSIGAIFNVFLEKDAANNTSITANRLYGTYQIDLETDRNLATDSSGNPYLTMSFGAAASLNPFSMSNAVYYRARQDYFQPYTNNYSSNSLVGKKTHKYVGKATLHLVIDTYDKSVYTWFNSETENDVTYGPYAAAEKYINALNITTQEMMNTDSYHTIKSLKITELSRGEETKNAYEAIKRLPLSLCADPNAVDSDIDISSYTDYTWTTSDDKVMTSDGKITRWYDEREVTLTATKDHVSKNYHLVIKPLDVTSSVMMNEFNGENFTYTAVDSLANTRCDVAQGATITKIEPEESVQKIAGYGIYDLYANAFSDEGSSAYYKDLCGVYDFEFDAVANVTGKNPVSLSVGRNSDSFEGAATLNYYADTVTLSYTNTNGEAQETALIRENEAYSSIKLRLDTQNKLLYAFVDGKLRIKDISYNSDSAVVNAARISVLASNKMNDSITLSNVKVTEIYNAGILGRDALLEKIALFNIGDYIDTPQAVNNITALPDTFSGEKVKWSCDSELINLDTNTVLHSTTDTNVKLTMIISGDDKTEVKRVFNLVVPAAQTPQQQLEYYLGQIESNLSKQPGEDLRYDLDLVYFDEVDVTYSSMNDTILGNDGKLKNVLVTENTPVTLTATVSDGQNSVSKDFTFYIKKLGYDKNLSLSQETLTNNTLYCNVEDIEKAKLTYDTDISFDMINNGGGKIMLSDSKGNSALEIVMEDDSYYLKYKDSALEEYPCTQGTTLPIKVRLIPEKSKMAVWIDGRLVADYVGTYQEIADFYCISAADGLSVKNVSVDTDTYGALHINLDNMDYFGQLDALTVNKSIALMTDTVLGAQASWKSDNNALLSSGGVFNAGKDFSSVNLTLELKDSEHSDAKIEKSIKLLTEPLTKNLADGAKFTFSASANVSNAMNICDNDYTTYAQVSSSGKETYITVDMGQSVPLNTLFVRESYGDYDSGIRSYTVSYSNDNGSYTQVASGSFTDKYSGEIKFNTVEARYVRFAINSADSAKLNIAQIGAFWVVSDEEFVKMDIDLTTLTRDALVTSNLTLPTVGKYGTPLQWRSSNTDVISNSGVIGSPSLNTDVTMTVYAFYGTKEYKKDFLVTVKGTTGGGSTISGGGGGGGGGSNKPESVVPGFISPTVEAPSAVKSSFADVDENSWALSYIEELKEKGIVSGDENGMFNPKNNVKREEFLKMILIAANIEIENISADFADVKSDGWYSSYVYTGQKHGIINGVTDKTFGIGMNITREDMAVILQRVLNKAAQPTEVYFADDAQISSYARDAVYAMQEAGIISGYNGLFNPKANLTREEAAKVVALMMKELEN